MGIQQVIDNPGIGEFELVAVDADNVTPSDPGADSWQISAAGNRIDISQLVNGHDLSGMLSLISVNAELYLRTDGETQTYRVVGIAANTGFHSITVDPVGTRQSTGFALAVGGIHSVGFANPSADGVPGPIGPVGPEGPKGDKGDTGDPGSDATVTKPAVESVLTGEITTHTHPAAALASVAVLVVSTTIAAGTAVTSGNTSGDSPVPYGAGQLGNAVLVFINGVIKTAADGAGSDLQEVTPASGTFSSAQDLYAGDVIQMIPR